MAGKRIAVWLASLIGATVVTYIIFEYTPVAIPFFAGGFFTVLSVILMTFVFSIPLDAILKASVYDERGVHFGIFDLLGANSPNHAVPAPDKNQQPIVSREERAKKAQQLAGKK